MSQAGHNHLYFDHLKGDFSILKSKLDNVFIVNDITSDDKKRAYLITSLCDDTYKLLASLSVPKKPDELKFTELIVLLEKHFKPAISYFASRRKFYYAKQGHEESVREFAARLRSLAGDCGFKSSELELLMRDIFVFGLTEAKIQDRLQEEDATSSDITFKKLLNLTLKRESSEQFSVNLQHFYQFRLKCAKSTRTYGNTSTTPKVQQRCLHCGRNNHQSFECNYKNYTCNICNVKGHLAPVCTKKMKEQHQKKYFKFKVVYGN